MNVMPDGPEQAQALLELGLVSDSDDAALLDAIRGRIPDYELHDVLGRGGMGVVFLARHRRLDRLVALKVLNPELGRKPQFAARFEQEARALATLDHPGVVGIFDTGVHDGFFYIAMEYVDGASVRARMEQPLPVASVVPLVRSLCEILGYSHARGVIHRDIKPENVLIDRNGAVKVADFGLARLTMSPSVSLTNTLAAVGTIHYMAPEQFEAHGDVDHRADIYAVGVLMYELLTNKLPVGRFGPPSEEGADSSSLDSVVMRCLERDPARRFGDATELRQALTDRQVGLARRMRTALPAFRRRTLGAAIAVFAGVGMLTAVAHDEGHPEPPPQRECMTFGEHTECGYRCKAGPTGKVACAAKPDMECRVSEEGDVQCGYGCTQGADGAVVCAEEPGMRCLSAGTTVVCGRGCSRRDGGVVCPQSDEEHAPVIAGESSSMEHKPAVPDGQGPRHAETRHAGVERRTAAESGAPELPDFH